MFAYVLVFPLDSLFGAQIILFILSPEWLLAYDANTVRKCNYNLWVYNHQVMLFMNSLFVVHVNCLWSKGLKTPVPEMTELLREESGRSDLTEEMDLVTEY